MHPKRKYGVEIESVAPESPAARAGIRAGDTLLKVGGNPVSDMIDYLFHKEGRELALELERAGRVTLDLAGGPEDPGITLKHFPVKRCGNHCGFCFVSQLPKGMRKTLYVKDEDYRMSFIYGNYITMANLTAADKRRIARQRLSPLYISIHSTDNGIRRRLLGNPKAPDVMKDLEFFRQQRLRIHTQIVLCPGINDGENLVGTIRDLYRFHPYVMSVAVVPAGLVPPVKAGLRMVEKEDAIDAVSIIERFQRRFRKRHGENFAYGADELYIKAGLALPDVSEYGELPQLENGVGMVPLFLHEAKKLKPATPSGLKLRYLAFTGVSFYPYLKTFTDRLNKKGHDIRLVGVPNGFFGPTVTVTGLLTGRDVLRGLGEEAASRDILLVPDTAVKEGEDMFLDDLSIADIGEALGIRTSLIEATPRGLVRALGGDL
ncbi:MAG: DUF512 domain-containing protein [Nitrospiraceae bacterium]|nr:DUF512 domain-containing protein [Nitrospiraceae bacterium]